MNLFTSADANGNLVIEYPKISGHKVYGFQRAEMRKNEVYKGERYPRGTNSDADFRYEKTAPIGVIKESDNSIRQSLPLVNRLSNIFVSDVVKKPNLGLVFNGFNTEIRGKFSNSSLEPNSVLENYMDVNNDGSIRKAVDVNVKNDNHNILNEYKSRVQSARLVAEKDAQAGKEAMDKANDYLLKASPDLYRTIMNGQMGDGMGDQMGNGMGDQMDGVDEEYKGIENKKITKEYNSQMDVFLKSLIAERNAELNKIKDPNLKRNVPDLVKIYETKGSPTARKQSMDFMIEVEDEVKSGKIDKGDFEIIENVISKNLDIIDTIKKNKMEMEEKDEEKIDAMPTNPNEGAEVEEEKKIDAVVPEESEEEKIKKQSRFALVIENYLEWVENNRNAISDEKFEKSLDDDEYALYKKYKNKPISQINNYFSITNKKRSNPKYPGIEQSIRMFVAYRLIYRSKRINTHPLDFFNKKEMNTIKNERISQNALNTLIKNKINEKNNSKDE